MAVKIKWIFLAVWLLSIAVFIFGQLSAPNDYVSIPGNPWGAIFGISVITGILAFVLMVGFFAFDLGKGKKSTTKAKSVDMKFLKRPVSLVAALLIILTCGGTVLAAKYIQLNKPSASSSLNVAPSDLIDDSKLLGLVNDYRKSQNLDIVSQDDETCKVAQKRIDKYFMQKELDVNNYKDVCPTCTFLSVADSQGNYDLNSILTSWKNNKSTLDTLKSQYKYGCIKSRGGDVTFVMAGKSNPTKTNNVTNSDPTTDCISTAPNCNGESIRLKQSQCQNITCCQVGNTWSVYASTQKCTEAQKNVQAPQPQGPTQATTSLNFYCYDNTNKYSYYTSSGEQCNKNNRISSCKGTVKSTYDLCMQTCLNTANEGTDICIWGYGAGGHIEDNPDLQQQCFDENNAEHKSCMDACSGPYQSNSLNCNNTP